MADTADSTIADISRLTKQLQEALTAEDDELASDLLAQLEAAVKALWVPVIRMGLVALS